MITGWNFRALLQQENSFAYAAGCRVLARATPDDKKVYVEWLQGAGEVTLPLQPTPPFWCRVDHDCA